VKTKGDRILFLFYIPWTLLGGVSVLGEAWTLRLARVHRVDGLTHRHPAPDRLDENDC
jgi:hypothetical protein